MDGAVVPVEVLSRGVEVRDVAFTLPYDEESGTLLAPEVGAARISVALVAVEAMAPPLLRMLDRIANEKIDRFLAQLPKAAAGVLKRLIGAFNTEGGFDVRCEEAEGGIRLTIEEKPRRFPPSVGGSMVIGLAAADGGRLRISVGELRPRVIGRSMPPVPSTLLIDAALKIAPKQPGLYPVGSGSIEVDLSEVLAAREAPVRLAARVREVRVVDGVLNIWLG